MKRINQFRIIAPVGWLVCAMLCANGLAEAEPYVWPLDDSKNISSGFCSYREAHYHGGVDISTNGREGLPVRAADSGFVLRVTTSYWGYGKGVYLQLADGKIAVYGHLSDFSGPIRKYVEKQQYSLKRYNTNLFPLADELPIGRGEVIGYTGQSGYGPPHLHYEIRTGENYPVNPLALDIGYTDRTAPNFAGVLVRPLLTMDPHVRVDGKPSPVFLKAEKAGSPNRFVVKKPVAVNGPVGLAVECSDPTDYKGYAIPPSRLSMSVNGLQFFEKSYDSLDFALTRQLDLDYDFDWLAASGDHVQTLYRHPGNVLPWYDPRLTDGVLDPGRSGSQLTPGENRLEITASDPAGNKAVLELTVVINQPPRAGNIRLQESAGQWYITGQADEPDDYVARFMLQRRQADSFNWETMWEKNDSVVAEYFEYIVPGPFTPGDDVRLVLVDHLDAESTFPVKVPGVPPDWEAPNHETTQLVCDFVPGGLIVHNLHGDESVGDNRISMLASVIRPLPDSWNFFLNAREFYRVTEDETREMIVLTEDRQGIDRGLHPAESMPESDLLIWPRELQVVDPDQSTTIYSIDSVARARFNAGDVFDGAFYRIRRHVHPRSPMAQPASAVYLFEPISVPFARKVEVAISYAGLPAEVDNLALYALRNDRKSWSYLGRDVDVGGRFMSARVWSFGPYALVADTEPPKISQVVPGRGAKTSDPRPEITFNLADDLSGIGSDQDIEIILDGEWLIPEYDPETLRGKTRPPRDLQPGKHKLEITARDRVGHEEHFLRYFTVVK